MMTPGLSAEQFFLRIADALQRTADDGERQENLQAAFRLAGRDHSDVTGWRNWQFRVFAISFDNFLPVEQSAADWSKIRVVSICFARGGLWKSVQRHPVFIR